MIQTDSTDRQAVTMANVLQTLAIVRTAILLLGAFILYGCASRSMYPHEWAPTEGSNSRDTCPEMSGTYDDWGELSPGTPSQICEPEFGYKGIESYPLDWECDVSLSWNLVGRRLQAEPPMVKKQPRGMARPRPAPQARLRQMLPAR